MALNSNSSKERWIILGASRGLGQAFARLAATDLDAKREFLLVARKEDLLRNLQAELKERGATSEVFGADFSDSPTHPDLLSRLEGWNPHRIFYFAGGGPYGNFETKSWKDHEWALQVSFLFPLRLLHSSLKWPGIQQWIFIGSSIAENKGDPKAASYAASKHALLGALRSLRAENGKDLRLFSPGYMDTDLLPRGTKARHKGKVWSAETVAKTLLKWSTQERGQEEFHRVLPDYADE